MCHIFGVFFAICVLHFQIDLMTSVSLGKVYVFLEKSWTRNVRQLFMNISRWYLYIYSLLYSLINLSNLGASETLYLI